MAARETISNKTRFEVFKRDSFTCQYCGKMSPDVTLEIDHISPVSKGGKNNIMNLITSCFECNRGKGCKELTDNQVIKQQQEQLKEINKRREQLKLLLKWKKELEKFDAEQIDMVDEIIYKRTELSLSDIGRRCVLKNIREFGVVEVMEAMQISLDRYYEGVYSMNLVLKRVGGICYNIRQKNIVTDD